MPGLLARFDALSDSRKFEFYKDFYDAKPLVYQSLNISDGKYFNIWNEFEYLIKERKNIEVLRMYDRFKNLKPNEFKHVWELHGTAGGHRLLYVATSGNPGAFYKIILDGNFPATKLPSFFNGNIINGHLIYENLYKINNNTTPYLLNGIYYSKKTMHYAINPLWNEQKLLEEMAFAYANKIEKTSSSTETRLLNVIYDVKTQFYESAFSDGTKLEFIYKSHAKDPVNNNKLVKNHMSLMTIVKKYSN